MLYGCFEEILHHFPQKQLVLGSSEGSVQYRFCLYKCHKKCLRGCGENLRVIPDSFLCLFLEGFADCIDQTLIY